jgi:hypothetical protein
MVETQARQQCEKLRNFINRGPGEDPGALREALRIVDTVRQSAGPYPRSRLTAISAQLGRWFSVDKWREVSDPAGLHLRDCLMQDITIVEKTWKPATAPSTDESESLAADGDT